MSGVPKSRRHRIHLRNVYSAPSPAERARNQSTNSCDGWNEWTHASTHVDGLVAHDLDVLGHQAPSHHIRPSEIPEKGHIIVVPPRSQKGPRSLYFVGIEHFVPLPIGRMGGGGGRVVATQTARPPIRFGCVQYRKYVHIKDVIPS